MGGPSLGINLSRIIDSTSAFPFINHFKTARQWLTGTEDRFNTREADLLNLDENGYLIDFPPPEAGVEFDRITTVMFTDDIATKPGQYTVSYQGEGTVIVRVPEGGTIDETSPGKIVFTLPADFSVSSVFIDITETDPNGTGEYLRDFSVVHEDDLDLFEAGVLFAPEYIEKIEDFRVLRFMDWMATNQSNEVEWADRRTPDSAFFTGNAANNRGAAVEVMVELANTVKADAWFNIPHAATDEYIREFATYVRDNLDEGLVARFEYSNEVWSSENDAFHFSVAKAEADLGLSADDIPQAARQGYGVRAAEMASIIADVFGEQTGTRALNVFAPQTVFLGGEQFSLDAPTYADQGFDAPRDAPFHVYAIAPYFGGVLGNRRLIDQVDEWIAQGEQGFLNAIEFIRTGDVGLLLSNLGDIIAYHAGIAEGLGWQLEGYEGGQNINDRVFVPNLTRDDRVDFFNALVARPEMADLYQELFELWRDNGGGLLVHYNDIVRPSEFGSNGLWPDVYAPNTSRADATEDFRDNEPIFWDDPRPASTFENGDYARFTDAADDVTGTTLADSLFGLAGDDTIRGLNGDNLIWGGDGNDRLIGGTGDDRIDGGDGDDIIRGQNGDNVLSGGGGGDMLAGGNGADSITGGDGDDEIEGRGGNDTLSGGDGDDEIMSNDGDDLAHADAGDDYVDGGRGDDTLHGGDGDDTLDGFTDDDVIHGDDGDDDLIGDAGNDLITGGEGFDDIDSGSGNDTVEAGDDEDRVLARAGNDLVSGGNGRDDLNGGSGNDTLLGDSGRDTLKGGSGNDCLDGGTGDDEIHGGNGTDIIAIAVGDSMDTVFGLRDGGQLDTLELAGRTPFALANLATETADGVLIDFGAGDSLLLAGETLSILDELTVTFV